MSGAVRCEQVTLAPYTTLRLGGPARRFLEVGDTDELIAEVTAADRDGEPLLVLGGGSNLVIADAGFDGTVVHVATRGQDVVPEGDGRVRVRVRAGEEWDPFVARCVADGLSGIECLSGIPGLVGSTPIQNVGAYGQEVAQTITEVRALDRPTGRVVTLGHADCGFTYRNSVFKGTDRYVVLDVTFALETSGLSAPIRYGELARTLGVSPGDRVPVEEARAAVLGLRRGKGMVLDPADPDTRSAGSFFTNPILTAEEFAALEHRIADRLGPGVEFPRYPEPDGRVKTSAAWLIERAGFTKGYTKGPARISTKHTLALTNPGTAHTTDLLALAREVRDGVQKAFGVTLTNEPILIGTTL